MRRAEVSVEEAAPPERPCVAGGLVELDAPRAFRFVPDDAGADVRPACAPTDAPLVLAASRR
jgi:hypothetical protein